LSPCASASSIRTVVTATPGRVAFVAGHEGEGLTRGAMDACDRIARIPMAPGVDSLNVSTAVAIALYEFAVARGGGDGGNGDGEDGGDGGDGGNGITNGETGKRRRTERELCG